MNVVITVLQHSPQRYIKIANPESLHDGQGTSEANYRRTKTDGANSITPVANSLSTWSE